MPPEKPDNLSLRIKKFFKDFKSRPPLHRWILIGALVLLVVAVVAAAVLFAQFRGHAPAPTGPGVNPSVSVSAGQGVGGAPVSPGAPGKPRPSVRLSAAPTGSNPSAAGQPPTATGTTPAPAPTTTPPLPPLPTLPLPTLPVNSLPPIFPAPPS